MPTALSNEQILKAHHNDELFFGRKMRKKPIQKLNIYKRIIIKNNFCENYNKYSEKRTLALESQAITRLKPS